MVRTFLALAFSATVTLAADPLSLWNDTAPKKAVFAFVEMVTKEGSPDFVPVAERIATFDNDGTLWCEQPMYVQLRFALDRVKTLAPQHPEWKTKSPFNKLLSTPEMATCKCSNGRPPAAARVLQCAFITRMPGVNGLMTANRTSANSTRDSTKQRQRVGRS